MREITLSPEVTSIGEFAFYECENLQEITIPSSVTSIEDNAFGYCKNLQRINIPVGTLEKFKKLLPDEAHLLHEI